MIIIPTILEREFDAAEFKIELVKDLTKWVQVDVVDNVFAPGKTFELELLTKIRFNTEDLLWDIHLMVKEPIKWTEKCIYAGASRVIGQVEIMDDRSKFVNEVHQFGMDAGIAFDVDTEITQIPEDTDLVLLLGRKAGFGNYEFDPRIVNKINQLEKLRQETGGKFQIAVDGGINQNNIKDVKNIDIAYCGAAIFNGNVKDNFINLKSQL